MSKKFQRVEKVEAPRRGPTDAGLRWWMLGALIGTLLSGCGEQSGAEAPVHEKSIRLFGPEFLAVELDVLIEREKKVFSGFKGQKIIKMAAPVRFTASLKQGPEEKSMTYIYTALEMAGVSPLPNVSHQMFVESAKGRIISVYVENQVAARIANELAAGQTAEFAAYHVYSYSRGPALLVVDWIPTVGTGEER